MSDNAEIHDNENKSGNILLPNDVPFLITRIGNSHSSELNLTYRCPRKLNGEERFLIATTTINASNLRNIRLEELDGQFFITNEASFGEPLQFTVESEDVGHLIIKSIIDEFAPEPEPDLQDSEISISAANDKQKDDLDVPKKYWRINKIAEEFSPLIMISCAVLLSLSASFWLIFK